MDASDILELIFFCCALWLGLYLLGRSPRKALLGFAGGGLVAYALALASDLLLAYTAGPWRAPLTRVHWLLLFLPALAWSGALPLLLPEDAPLRARLARLWRLLLLPAAALLYLLGLSTDLVLRPAQAEPGPLYGAFALVVLAPLGAGLVAVATAHRHGPRRRMMLLAALAGTMFGMGSGLLLFPLAWLPRGWLVLAEGADLVALSIMIALFDAFDEGELLRPDMARSLVAASVTALLFGGQVALALALGAGLSGPTVALLLSVLASAIALQVFLKPLQETLDRIAFAGLPRLRQARAELRGAAELLPRLDVDGDVAQLDEAEFARLIRRALSHYGDLARLAASPLTRLPLVEARLASPGAGDQLERAVELKALLTESIARLKPRGRGDFGTSDEWRYYNALYFPYVLGLKPYSRRAGQATLDPVTRQALDWFQSAVPERTLYNWQTIGARLIAQDLWPRLTAADAALPAEEQAVGLKTGSK